MTNNEAEATSLARAVHQLDELRRKGVDEAEGSVRIFGDSQLIINWCLNLFKRVNKPTLYQ
jgi:ribonuclease HI